MKKIAKFISLVIACILCIVLLGVVIVAEKYDDHDVEKAVGKAEVISQDFSYVVSCNEVEQMEEIYDPATKKTIKSLDIRISSGYVLETKYDENNKIISSEIVYRSSVGNRLQVLGLTIILCALLFWAFWTGHDLIEQHREGKMAEDEEDDEDDRVQTVYEKRKFLWF